MARVRRSQGARGGRQALSADALARAVDLAVARRGCREAVEIPGGWALRHPALPTVYHLNLVHLSGSATGLGADDLVRLADRWLAGCGHRRVTLDDATAAEALAPELTARGWERGRTLFMALAGDPARALVDPRAREVSDAELVALQRATFAQDTDVVGEHPGLPARLADAQSALRAGTRAIGFGAGEHGDLASMATLFLDPDVGGRRVALIDQVATLRDSREQGLAKAAVSAAVRAAGAWDAQLIALPADADDWPQLMYASLGFIPVGRQLTFTRRGSGWGPR